MARFYFHLHDSDATTLDDEGLELDSLDVAKAEAVRALLEITKEIALEDGHGELSFTVSDDVGQAVARATITIALT
jgi:hypothetical protein